MSCARRDNDETSVPVNTKKQTAEALLVLFGKAGTEEAPDVVRL